MWTGCRTWMNSERGLDPENRDTDCDGAGDGDEVLFGTDPLFDPGDFDGDGLSDDLEIVLGLYPEYADSDSDWASDGYEVAQGTNPRDLNERPPLDVVTHIPHPFRVMSFEPRKSSSVALRATELFLLLTHEIAGAGHAGSCSST